MARNLHIFLRTRARRLPGRTLILARSLAIMNIKMGHDWCARVARGGFMFQNLEFGGGAGSWIFLMENVRTTFTVIYDR